MRRRAHHKLLSSPPLPLAPTPPPPASAATPFDMCTLCCVGCGDFVLVVMVYSHLYVSSDSCQAALGERPSPDGLSSDTRHGDAHASPGRPVSHRCYASYDAPSRDGRDMTTYLVITEAMSAIAPSCDTLIHHMTPPPELCCADDARDETPCMAP